MAIEWFHSRNGQKYGPFTEQQFKQRAIAGVLQPTDLVWKTGATEWVPASRVKGLFPQPQNLQPPISASPAAPSPLGKNNTPTTAPDVLQESYRAKGEFDRAISESTESIRLDPSRWNHYYNRGESYRAIGSYDRAISDFTEAIRLNPSDWRPYYSRGDTYRKEGNYVHAISDLSEAIRLNPEWAMSYWSRGEAFRSNGDYDRVNGDLTKAKELDPTLSISLYDQQGGHTSSSPQQRNSSSPVAQKSATRDRSEAGESQGLGKGDAAVLAVATVAHIAFPPLGLAVIGAKGWLDKCPSCSKWWSKQKLGPKVISIDAETRVYDDETYRVTCKKTQSACVCQKCAFEWTEGSVKEERTVVRSCPDCDHVAEYDCSSLESTGCCDCTKCGSTFFTAAQTEYRRRKRLDDRKEMISMAQFWDRQGANAALNSNFVEAQFCQGEAEKCRRLADKLA